MRPWDRASVIHYHAKQGKAIIFVIDFIKVNKNAKADEVVRDREMIGFTNPEKEIISMNATDIKEYEKWVRHCP